MQTRDERFWGKVDAAGDCWIWTAGRTGAGYGAFWEARQRQELAHRYSWLSLVGPIPEGLTLDHLCRVRTCVNPAHLEPVTPQENWARAPRRKRLTCAQGHSLHDAFVKRGGSLNCRPCLLESTRRRRAAIHGKDGRHDRD